MKSGIEEKASELFDSLSTILDDNIKNIIGELNALYGHFYNKVRSLAKQPTFTGIDDLNNILSLDLPIEYRSGHGHNVYFRPKKSREITTDNENQKMAEVLSKAKESKNMYVLFALLKTLNGQSRGVNIPKTFEESVSGTILEMGFSQDQIDALRQRPWYMEELLQRYSSLRTKYEGEMEASEFFASLSDELPAEVAGLIRELEPRKQDIVEYEHSGAREDFTYFRPQLHIGKALSASKKHRNKHLVISLLRIMDIKSNYWEGVKKRLYLGYMDTHINFEMIDGAYKALLEMGMSQSLLDKIINHTGSAKKILEEASIPYEQSSQRIDELVQENS